MVVAVVVAVAGHSGRAGLGRSAGRRWLANRRRRPTVWPVNPQVVVLTPDTQLALCCSCVAASLQLLGAIVQQAMSSGIRARYSGVLVLAVALLAIGGCSSSKKGTSATGGQGVGTGGTGGNGAGGGAGSTGGQASTDAYGGGSSGAPGTGGVATGVDANAPGTGGVATGVDANAPGTGGTTTGAGGNAPGTGGTTTGTGGGKAGPGGTASGTGGTTTGTGGGKAGAGGTTSGTGGTATGTGGSPCGAVGKACCAGNTCTGSACCAAGQCVSNGSSCSPLDGTCASGVCGTCGGPGTPCCSNPDGTSNCTAPGTTCLGGQCYPCGNSEGAFCCALTNATSGITSYVCPASGLVCDGNSSYSLCAACGKPGSACCAGNTCEANGCCFDGRCVAERGACNNGASADGGTSGGTCVAGHCADCGGKNQPCCGSATPTCATGLLCRSGACSTCGGLGETCCPATADTDACVAGAICSPAITGTDGLCAKCGSPGESCCAGNTCSSGCCLADHCMADGGDCVFRSVTYGQCKSGRCGCGNLDEPCCPVVSNRSGSPCKSPDVACTAEFDYSSTTPGRCVTCGILGNPCCAGSECTDTALECRYGNLGSIYTCQSCGELGQNCCESVLVPPCKNPAAVCDSFTTYPGLCALCGTAGGPCCVGGVCTEANTDCFGSRCAKCGTRGAQCCKGNACTDGCCVSRFAAAYPKTCVSAGAACEASASSSAGPTCATDGSCQEPGTPPCGGLGQPCCTSISNPSFVSYNYCGAQGTRCTYSSVTLSYTCTACGDKGQQCCSDSTGSSGACKSPYTCVSTSSGGTNVYTCIDPTSTMTATAISTATSKL
jgi:hypothetical protein